MDGISTDHLEIARLMGRNTKLDTLPMDDHVEIAWLIGMLKDLECTACDVQFLENNMDK